MASPLWSEALGASLAAKVPLGCEGILAHEPLDDVLMLEIWDLGPDGGPGGARLAGECSPAGLVDVAQSYTGAALARHGLVLTSRPPSMAPAPLLPPELA